MRDFVGSHARFRGVEASFRTFSISESYRGLKMVKLTPELIETCAQYTNPVRDRELDLRGKVIRLFRFVTER